jgi:hypothetical protein
MTQSGSDSRSGRKPTRIRGVTELPERLGERRFRARISLGRGQRVNLGLYPTRWLAAFAYNVAALELHGPGRAKNAIPEAEQPSSDQVRRITASVRRRLGLEQPLPPPGDRPPSAEQLITLFEIAVVGFWRGQAADHGAHSSRDLQSAARRLAEAAEVLFWSQASGHPTPLEVLNRLLARRLDQSFRRADLTREVLDDEGDDEVRIAFWLVFPDDWPGGGFRATIGHLYSELLGPGDDESRATPPAWAAVLGIAPPFHAKQVRAAYRARSKEVHPDAGGDHAEFVRLQAAYEQAQRYCASRGI